MHEFTYISAFAAGLLGGVHCIGMCGGIVGALSFGVAKHQSGTRLYTILLAYNLARITSYVIAGNALDGYSCSTKSPALGCCVVHAGIGDVSRRLVVCVGTD